MKVVHFVSYYPPERVGGVGECVAGLHAGLLAAGHESLVVTSGQHSQAGIQRIARTSVGWLLKSATWVRTAAQADIVHCQAGEAFFLVVLLAVYPRKAKILTTFHVSSLGIRSAWQPYSIEGQIFGRGFRPWFYRTVVCGVHHVMDRIVQYLSDQVNMISEAGAREISAERQLATANIIYYGLADRIESEEGAQPEAPLPCSRTDLLYVGVGGHRKRVLALPFILQHVHTRVPEARLRILGFEADTEPQLSALFAARQLLPYVEYLGVKRSSELSPYYAQASVLLVPSAYEGLPFVILEAMQAGLPVVATHVSGHPEVIQHGRNGFLVDVDCPDQMAAHCVRLLTDTGLRQTMAQAARQTVHDRFRLDRQVDDYLALYEALRKTECEV